MKVLIIDDEPILRRALSRAFSAKGHEVQAAEGGEQGLKLWREHKPELVMLDVLMPDLNGPQVIERLGSDTGNAFVVLMSAFTGDFDSQRAKQYGAHEFLSKPFDDVFKLVEGLEERVN
ncbi:MAG: response regulator [Bdellovibrionales bacterium]|nr:response regulator [Bdellovibrionales bacterium]